MLLKSADELLNYSKSEENHIENIVKSIVDAKVNVVIAGGSISDLALHYFDRYNILVFRVMSKFEIRRIAKSVGASLLVRLGPPTEEEVGHADRVYVDEIAFTKCIIIERDDDSGQLATIIVRGSTQNICDNIEKIIEEGVNAYKNLTRDNTYLPGAGATEMYLSNVIKEAAKKESNLDSYAITKFGEAFEVVPRNLSDNAGLNSNELIAKLNTENSKNYQMGINLATGEVEDAFSFGALDHRDTKKWAVKFSVDAILTVLRVDQIILSKPAGGPSFKKPPGYTNEEDEF